MIRAALVDFREALELVGGESVDNVSVLARLALVCLELILFTQVNEVFSLPAAVGV